MNTVGTRRTRVRAAAAMQEREWAMRGEKLERNIRRMSRGAAGCRRDDEEDESIQKGHGTWCRRSAADKTEEIESSREEQRRGPVKRG